MAINIKEGIKVFYMEPSGDWIGCYLRHCDQTMLSGILTRLRFCEYETVLRPDWDALPEVMRNELSIFCDVYRMEFFRYDENSMEVKSRNCFLLDPCKDLETILLRMKICTRIYSERTNKGLTQERLAELSGVPEKSISQIERGLWSPTIDVMIKLGTALGIELKYVEPINDK